MVQGEDLQSTRSANLQLCRPGGRLGAGNDHLGSTSYAHGGISLQEGLTPVLVVSSGTSSAPAAAITEISWKGLCCNLEASGGTAGMTADLRRDAAGGPSLATTAKPIDAGGARLLVGDEELEGTAVVAVLLSPDGRVIPQRCTVVGGD